MSSSDDEASIKEKRKEKKEKRDAEKAKQKEIIAENQEKLKKSSTAVLAGGSVVTLISLTFLCVSFGTSEWIIYTVEPSYTKTTVNAAAKETVSTGQYVNSAEGYICGGEKTSNCQFFYTRHRGLFMTCFEDTTATVFTQGTSLSKAAISSTALSGKCAWEQYYGIGNTATSYTNLAICQDLAGKNPGGYIPIQQNMLRTHWLLFAAAVVLEMVSFVGGIVARCRARVVTSGLAAVTVSVGTLFTAVGMSFFHGYEYIENNQLLCNPFYGQVLTNPKLSNLKSHASESYGYSMYLGWVSVGVGIIASIMQCSVFATREKSNKKVEEAKKKLKQLQKDEEKTKKEEEKEDKKREKEKKKKEKEDKKKKKEKKKDKKKDDASSSDDDSDKEEEKKKKKKEKEKKKKEEKEKEEEEKEKEKEEKKEKEKKKKEKEKKEKEEKEEEKEKEKEEKKKKEKEKKEKEKEKEAEKKDDKKKEDKPKEKEKEKEKEKPKEKEKEKEKPKEKPKDSGSSSEDEKPKDKPKKPPPDYTPPAFDPFTLHLPTGLKPPPYKP